MTDCVPIQSELRAALAAATEEANQWRGRCVNLFACAEAAIGAALAQREPSMKLPMLISQKAQRLGIRLNSEESQGKLGEFSALLADRTPLTHGVGKIWAGDNGKWLLTLDWATNKGPERRTFSNEEAAVFHKRLRSTVRSLESVLQAP